MSIKIAKINIFIRQSTILVAAAVGMAILVILHIRMVNAAAPSGVTLTGTALTVQVGQTVAINTLTITEDASPQIASTTDIRINIPTTVNAYWDTSDTTATLGGTAGGSSTSSPTVSYPDGNNRVLKIDVLLDYLANDTLTIDGLSIIGYDSATAAAALTWSVDGGAATGTADSTTNITVSAGDASAGSVATSDSTKQQTVNVTVSFTTATSTPSDGKIEITFPSGYSLTGTTSATCSTMDGSFALSVSGLVATITRSGGTAQTAAAESCTINNVRNPLTLGATGTFTVRTLNASDAAINSLSNITGVSITAGRGAGPDTSPPGAATSQQLVNVGDGSSLDLSWVNPLDDDLSSVRIYRSTVSGALGDLIATATSTSTRDTGLTTGTRYYYLLRPVDMSNNEYPELTALQGVPEVVAPSELAPPAPEEAPSEVAPPPPPPPSALTAGDLVRSPGSSTVYYYGRDGKRHVFPNEKVYFSWYKDFTGVKTVSDTQLASLPLGGLVRLRPGTKLVKIVSDPKVYAVEPGGVLRWVPNEEQATLLFGKDWAKRVVDVDVALFVAYSIGPNLEANTHPRGAVFRYQGQTQRFYVDKESGVLSKRPITDEGFSANRFSDENVVTIPATVTYPQGSSVTSKEDLLLRVDE